MTRRPLLMFSLPAAGLALAYAVSQARAEGVPAVDALAYSGTLEEGGELVEGAREVTVELWLDPASVDGEDLACAAGPTTVDVERGRFRVVLGADCERAVETNPDLYVEVIVGAASLGRARLGAVPYAIEARRAQSAGGPLRLELDALSQRQASPPGSVVAYAGDVAPQDWLLCDGSLLAIADDVELFAAIGARYGGDGVTTFALPDLRGRALVGRDDMGGAAAGRVTSSSSSGIDGVTLGAAGGSEEVALTVAEMPSHAHGGSTGAMATTGPGVATHFEYNSPTGTGPLRGFNYMGVPSGSGWQDIRAHTHGINAQGSGDAHPNMPPAMVLNWIIKR